MYRINELLKLDRKLYHTNDLAILWHMANRNTLYTTIKRHVQKGVLIPIYKGSLQVGYDPFVVESASPETQQ